MTHLKKNEEWMLLIVVIPPRRRISLVSLDFEVFEAAQFSFEQWPEEWRCIFFKLIKTVVVQTTTRLLKGLGCYLRRVKGPTYSANLGENSQNNKWKWGECWASRLMVTLNGIKKRARNSDIWNCNAPKSPLLTLANCDSTASAKNQWQMRSRQKIYILPFCYQIFLAKKKSKL